MIPALDPNPESDFHPFGNVDPDSDLVKSGIVIRNISLLFGLNSTSELETAQFRKFVESSATELNYQFSRWLLDLCSLQEGQTGFNTGN